jgi:succinate dehydrogenase/fumarate reductase flavoprotein subunit
LGVVLACGGYEWNEDLVRLSRSPSINSITVPSNRGDGHIMALEIGAAWAHLEDSLAASICFPGEQHDGKPLYRFFLFEPPLPGMIIVNQQGKRFANEGLYRLVSTAMEYFDFEAQTYPNLPCFAIYDQGYKEKYVITTVMPQDEAPEWMIRAPSIKELALKLGVTPDNLVETVSVFNTYAREGKDPAFRRGESFYDRSHGDRSHKPNPSLGPIEKPPFYGVQLVPASGFTTSGLVINGKAQVISVRREAIPGLYAVPNVAAHLAIGLGYSSGMVHSQSMAFGYIAADHMTGGAKGGGRARG